MKTIEELNEIRWKYSIVSSCGHIDKRPEEWKPIGFFEKEKIKCPCGCKNGELLELWYGYSVSLGNEVKCSETGMRGKVKYMNTLRGIIDCVIWDE